MTLLVLSWMALVCAGVPALLFLWNSFLFRAPPALPLAPAWRGEGGGASPPGEGGVRLSVLIPARNEELGIEACVRSVLASQYIEFEVIVLDDASTDRTAAIVQTIAAEDARLRLERAPPLPEGWCGKQHACFALAKFARFDTLTFLDADVRLAPDALARMTLFLNRSGAKLVSGFPRQETGTILEKLLIPLINWLLMCFLPLWGMRHFRWSMFGAGCGQWFMSTRAAYEKVGGHEAVKSSLHDGLTLPRAYRKAGFFTDVCDATDLAICRMYRSARAVWFGLAKNAREGMAANGQILFWTVVLVCGQVLPFVLWVLQAFALLGMFPSSGLWLDISGVQVNIVVVAVASTLLTRYTLGQRFHHPAIGWLLHPVAILLLLTVQWYAILHALIGRPLGWKGRTHPTDSRS